jgi:glycosyltransferase involved in cell wall biosynthesis
MKDKLVSIITPSYNCEKFISETINSIINQTFTDWELIITDDYSSDNSIGVIESFIKKDDRIRLYTLKSNQGAGAARNHSIKMAKGRYIAFCDSDDQWKINKLELQLNLMIKNNIVLSYSGYDVIGENGNYIRTIYPPKIITFKKILSNNYIGCLTAIYDSKIIGKQYMPLIRKRQDWVLWITILKKIKKTEGINTSLATYRLRSNSISRNKFNLIIHNWNVYHQVLGYNKFKSVLLMLNFIIHYAIKVIK